jgi:plasmid stabilization system protein ParE
MSAVQRRTGVDDDIFDIATHLSFESVPLAHRFIDSAEQSLAELAEAPRIGSRKDFDDPKLARVRTWRVKGFPNHLIYYIAMAKGIDVLAVMHGAQLPEARLRQRATRK